MYHITKPNQIKILLSAVLFIIVSKSSFIAAKVLQLFIKH